MTTTTANQIVQNAKIISVNTLVDTLKNITKSTVTHVIYLVDDTRSKTVKGVKQVQKLVEITHVYLNHNYTNKVNNLNGTSDFEALPLENFGKTRICSTIIASLKTGALMIDGKVLKSESAKILAYYHNGVEITAEQGEEMGLWANNYYTPTEKATMGRGTVAIEDDFAIINTYLSRIKHIKLSGEWLTIA